MCLGCVSNIRIYHVSIRYWSIQESDMCMTRGWGFAYVCLHKYVPTNIHHLYCFLQCHTIKIGSFRNNISVMHDKIQICKNVLVNVYHKQRSEYRFNANTRQGVVGLNSKFCHTRLFREAFTKALVSSDRLTPLVDS